MFTPSTGILRVGQSLPILISFNPDALGEFSEDFPFVLQGAADPLVLSLRGNVVGPTFHFDKKCEEMRIVFMFVLPDIHYYCSSQLWKSALWILVQPRDHTS